MTREELLSEALKLDNQLCFPLYAAARRVTALYTPVLKPLGLTYTQYIIFLALWEENSMTVSRLMKRLFLDVGTLSPILKKLEREGYITRTRNEDDQRVVTVTLTESGRALKEKVRDVPLKIMRCINLSGEDAEKLHLLLHRLLKDEEG